MINLIVFMVFFFGCLFLVWLSLLWTPWSQWLFPKASLHLRAQSIAPSGCFKVFVGSFTTLSPVSYLLNEGVRTGDRQSCSTQTVLILIMPLALGWSPLTCLTSCEWAVFIQVLRPLLPLFSPQGPPPLLGLPSSLRISPLFLSVPFREECNRFVSA